MSKPFYQWRPGPCKREAEIQLREMANELEDMFQGYDRAMYLVERAVEKVMRRRGILPK